MPSRNKKNLKKKIKIIDKLFYQIFLSVLLLLFLVLGTKINKVNEIINNNFYYQISFTKIAYKFSHVFSNIIPPVGDTVVYNYLIYDSVDYNEGINEVKNYSFDGVYNLCDSVVMKIKTNENGLFDIYTVNKDGYSYIYKNLLSIDVKIYSYLESETIIGKASYDEINKYYKFNLIIEKGSEKFSFYEMAED